MTVENFLLMTGSMLPRLVIYKDTLNSVNYVCDAEHGTTLAQNKWRVQKLVLDADGDVISKTETDGYDNLATDLATVQSLSYS